MTKYIYILSLLLLSVSSLFAQSDQGYLEIKGSAKVDRTPLLGSKIEVYKNGVLVKSYPSDSKGRFSFSIDLNGQYELVAVKQGYYSKRLTFNTQVPDDELGIFNYKFVVTMIASIEGFDASLLDKPIGIIMYVDDVGEFDYDEGYTFNMLKKLQALMKEYEKAKKKEYQRIIALADQAFRDKDYAGAMTLYDKSIDLDPYDPYPDDQMYVIEGIIAEDGNLQANYDKNISQADTYFAKDELVNAKKYYNKAYNYIKKEYPKSQIALIENKLNNADALAAEKAAKEKAYAAAIAMADKSFTAKQYDSSLAKYKEALKIKPTEQYPQDKISELNILIAQLLNKQKDKEALEKAYKEAVATADTKLGSKDYVSALSNYEKASKIKPSETYPKTKIDEINNILAANKSIDEKYDGFITIADKSFTAKEYESAKGYYQQALTIKKQEEYPKTKIDEIDILLRQIAEQRKKDVEGNYLRLIAAADVSFNKKEYSNAKIKYNNALELKSKEAYPKQRISEIDKLLADLASKKSAYDVAIARADNNFNTNKLQESKVDYQLALSIFPKEQYPQTRLNEIENKLLSLKNADDQLKAREKAYKDAIIKGDALLTEKKYQESKNAYSQASAIKTKEAYPKQKIAEIDKILTDQIALNNKYNTIVASADQYFLNEKYNEAKKTYTKALQVKSNEEYPKKKISEIDLLLASNLERENQYKIIIANADKQFNAKKYNDARTAYTSGLQIKPNEAYPKQKIDEINKLLASGKALDKRYNEIITTADNHFINENYNDAKTTYTNALKIKPNEAYPKQKISEIDVLLAQKLATQQALAADKKKYEKLIGDADIQFDSKAYTKAKGLYQQANLILVDEVYPKQKIVEIDNLLAGFAASDSKYKETIASANSLLAKKSYTQALASYKTAASIKPSEEYPKGKISEVEKLIKGLLEAEAIYNQHIKLADESFKNNELDKAKLQYQSALGVKPNEEYPKQRIVAVNKLLADRAKLLADKEKLEENYKAYISQADSEFSEKKYQQAIHKYTLASQLKPDEMHPKNRLSEIDNLLESLATIQKEYEQKMSHGADLFGGANYKGALVAYQEASKLKPTELQPKKKISEIQGLINAGNAKQEKYNGLIFQADKLFKDKKLIDSKKFYQQAQLVFPAEEYPKHQIEAIETLVAANAKREADLIAIVKSYKLKIAQADKLFGSKSYPDALSAYMDAKTIKSDETYPDQQIAKINGIIKTNVAQLEANYNAALSKGDQHKSSKSYTDAKSQYNIALGLKPGDATATARIALVNNLIEKDKLAKQKQGEINANYKLAIAKADKFFGSKNYPDALSAYMDAKTIKSNETYPDQQIIKIKSSLAELEAKYNNAISKGDKLKTSQSYTEARLQYNIALSLKPGDATAKSRIALVDNLMDKDKLAKQKQDKINADYKLAIAKADKLFGSKNYPDALSAYMDAKTIKSNETYPDQQIAKINGIVKTNAAQLEADYKAALSKGDKFKSSTSYAEAKSQYNIALGLKPGDATAKARIALVDNLIASDKLAKQKQDKVIADYKLAITKADKFFSSKNYPDALSAYMDAKMIKSDETYPDQQIGKIKSSLAQLEAKYSNAISKGDQLKVSKSYIEAKSQYNIALSLKPSDATAKSRIALIDNLIASDKLTKQKQDKTNAEYSKLISQADAAFKAKSYSSAIAIYKKAQSTKPNEGYPKKQIDLCEQKLKEQKMLASQAEEERRKAELAAAKSSFDKKDFDYSGEKRDKGFLNDLAKKYPEGVTVENYDKKNKKIKRVIVNHGGIAKEYIEVKYSYGTYYFRNGQNISRSIFYSETKN